MAEFEHGSEHIDEVDRIGQQELEEGEAKALSDRIVQDVVEGFAGHSRVIQERNGEEVSASLRLDPDLDPALFIDQLKGLNEVEVRLDYALNGKPAELEPEVTVGWMNDMSKGVRVTLHEGDVPSVATWNQGLDGKNSDYEYEEINGQRALELQSVMSGVKAALSERDRRRVDSRHDEGTN